MMGGYNSGGHNQKLVTVEASVRLDAAMLRRAGLLEADKPMGNYWTYSSRGRNTCTVLVIAGRQPDMLEVIIVTPDKAEHRQHVRISASPCNYGKHRHWLHCPHCGRRAFRLYYYPHTYSAGVQVHYFACRHCRRLTYQARRERGFDLYQSRCAAAKDKLEKWARAHGVTDYKTDHWEWDWPPDKPKGMRWATFAPIAQRWDKSSTLAGDAFTAKTAWLFNRSESLSKR